MARSRRPAARDEPLPPPLPPETRTVGQLVAESIRLYGKRFWAALALGVGPAVVGITLAELPDAAQLAVSLSVGPAVLTSSYIGATVIATGVRPTARSVAVALALGVLVLLPVPFLVRFFVLPAAAWLALIGLVVPVAIVERLGPKAALSRALALGRADYVHALGSLATLVILGLTTSLVLFFLLRGQGDVTLRVAAFLATVVIAPLVFLGAALLYDDQSARERVRRDRATARAPAPADPT